MIFKSRLACSMVAMAAMGLLAQRTQAASVGAAVSPSTASALIEHASWQSGAQSISALTRIVKALVAQRGGFAASAKYVDYYLGYANYVLAQDYVGQDNHQAGDCLDKAETALQQAIKTDPDFAEAHALLASVYGLEIGMHPMKGIWLGSRIGKQVARATALAPENPRITLIRAINDSYTPSAFGGSETRALKEFGQAIARFDHYASPNALAPGWGKAEAYALRGDDEMDAGHPAAARRDYQAALNLAPDYAAVKKELAKLQVPAGVVTNSSGN